MIPESLRIAQDHQERLRSEAAQRRRRNGVTPSRILASVAAVLRSAFPGPALAAGTILPATH